MRTKILIPIRLLDPSLPSQSTAMESRPGEEFLSRSLISRLISYRGGVGKSGQRRSALPTVDDNETNIGSIGIGHILCV